MSASHKLCRSPHSLATAGKSHVLPTEADQTQSFRSATLSVLATQKQSTAKVKAEGQQSATCRSLRPLRRAPRSGHSSCTILPCRWQRAFCCRASTGSRSTSHKPSKSIPGRSRKGARKGRPLRSSGCLRPTGRPPVDRYLVAGTRKAWPRGRRRAAAKSTGRARRRNRLSAVEGQVQRMSAATSASSRLAIAQSSGRRCARVLRTFLIW